MYFMDCPHRSTFKWRNSKLVKSTQLPYKNSSINVFDFEDVFSIRHDVYNDHKDIKKKTLMFYNIKGGCAKTTTSAQLIFFYSLMGYKVLAIDLDNQQDLTCSLGIDPENISHSIYNVMEGIPIEDAIIKVNETLHVLPANEDMDDIEESLLIKTRREHFLKKLIEPIKDDYDIIIIDSHPIKSLLNTAAIYASDMIITPTICDYMGYRGVIRVLNHIKDIANEAFEGDIADRVKIIPTRYRMVQKLEKTYLDAIYSDFKGMVTQRIRESAVFAKASDMSLSIFNLKQSMNKLTPEEFTKLSENGLFIGLSFKNFACEDLKLVGQELLTYMKD